MTQAEIGQVELTQDDPSIAKHDLKFLYIDL